jgi:hypothetical protein
MISEFTPRLSAYPESVELSSKQTETYMNLTLFDSRSMSTMIQSFQWKGVDRCNLTVLAQLPLLLWPFGGVLPLKLMYDGETPMSGTLVINDHELSIPISFY